MFNLKLIKNDKWQTRTRAGLMLRQHSKTGEMQYRDCLSNSWRRVEDEPHLRRLRAEAQKVSEDEPQWIQPGAGPRRSAALG